MSAPELPECNQDVYEHGYTYGVVDMPKAEAEALCKEKTAETGNQFDWHYSGGRVVIKCLTKEKAAELLAARTMTEELPKLKRQLTDLVEAAKAVREAYIEVADLHFGNGPAVAQDLAVVKLNDLLKEYGL